jgi:ribosomal protein S18 acetylase RimI-like enzyme
VEATVQHLIAVRRVVGQAFAADPLLVWMLPDEPSRLEACTAFLGLFVEEYLAGGRVDTVEEDGEVVGVAMWRIPGDAHLPEPTSPTIPGLLHALVGPDHLAHIGAGLRVLSEGRPETPYAYLHFLAVAPAHQGRGLGRRVIHPGLDAAAAAGLGVHLETMNPRNHAFYRSVGFTEAQVRPIPPDGPAATFMWLAPPAGP